MRQPHPHGNRNPSAERSHRHDAETAQCTCTLGTSLPSACLSLVYRENQQPRASGYVVNIYNLRVCIPFVRVCCAVQVS